MIIHTSCQQGSLEWLALRAGVVTASEFDNIVSPGKWEVRTGETPKTYLATKLAERWLGSPLPGGMTIEMEAGQIREEEAIPWFEFSKGMQIDRVAFVTTDDGKIGCSPDGLIGETSGVEIKCPLAHTHVKYLMAGTVPNDYLCQVHGAMLVTGRTTWQFVSYRRRFPALIVRVERDERICAMLKEALDTFNAKLDAAFDRLCELNGGPPKRPVISQTKQTEPLESTDIVP